MTRIEYDELKGKFDRRTGLMSDHWQMMSVKEWWQFAVHEDMLPFVYQDLKHTVESGAVEFKDQKMKWALFTWLEEMIPNIPELPEEHRGKYLEICKHYLNHLDSIGIQVSTA